MTHLNVKDLQAIRGHLLAVIIHRVSAFLQDFRCLPRALHIPDGFAHPIRTNPPPICRSSHQSAEAPANLPRVTSRETKRGPEKRTGSTNYRALAANPVRGKHRRRKVSRIQRTICPANQPSAEPSTHLPIQPVISGSNRPSAEPSTHLRNQALISGSKQPSMETNTHLREQRCIPPDVQRFRRIPVPKVKVSEIDYRADVAPNQSNQADPGPDGLTAVHRSDAGPPTSSICGSRESAGRSPIWEAFCSDLRAEAATHHVARQQSKSK
jgi:hypothetical protein